MKRKSFKYPVIVFIVTVLVCVIVNLWVSNKCFKITHYDIETRVTDSVRIVHLTDLHCAQFGEKNQKLISAVKEQKPDLIFVTGDLVNLYDEDYSVAAEFLSSLNPIAPVYCVMGNHEISNIQNFGNNLYKIYRDTGVTVLERSWCDVEIKGQKLRIGGLYGLCFPYPSDSQTDRVDESLFAEQFQDTDRTKLLLCHRPVSWIERPALDYWDIDAVFCGHAHGGQIRIPFVGALVAPDQGFFPGRDKGVYKSKDGTKTMILSTGLGGTNPVPRFNNIPEIVTVDLIPNK
ncbi:MAG: metallophosphoesterase [Clostridia bacterium]|nr:metallophosphoesterase [Clostridia bacterium]